MVTFRTEGPRVAPRPLKSASSDVWPEGIGTTENFERFSLERQMSCVMGIGIEEQGKENNKLKHSKASHLHSHTHTREDTEKSFEMEKTRT